jgi:hypothetical protein
VTTPDAPQGRPVPDANDLALLAEIINNGTIGLPQAAWNARMSQAEAAERFVTMAERGMPLRLVAEGDRQLLWHIAQAGPAGGFPVPAAAPAAPVHEHAVAVPLGRPPFGMPAAEPAQSPAPEAGSAGGSTWGLPGTSAWVRSDEPSPTRRVQISGAPTQSVYGLFGEHLDVSLEQIIDPADEMLTAAGYRLDPSERALLVRTAIGNRGPVDFESLPDLYLVLVSSTGTTIQKAAVSVAGYPAHRVGVPSGTHAFGWTVFLVPPETEVAQVRWSVRPDLADRTISWGFGPA